MYSKADFPKKLKVAYIAPVEKVIGLSVFYLLYVRHLNVVFMIWFAKTLRI